jgi:hypothetical protein
MNIKEEVSRFDKRDVWFRDEESGRKYRRIVGGFAWPAVKPGFVVVVAEDLEKDTNLDIRHLRVLGETEDFSVQELLRKSVEFRERYKAKIFYGDTDNKPMMEVVRQANEVFRKKDISTLYPTRASFVDDPRGFQFYFHTIKAHLQADKKTLHFGEVSKMPGYLMELTPEDFSSLDAQDFPAIAALGYAVAYFDIYQPLPPLTTPPQNIAESYSVNLDYRKKYI